MSKRSVIGLAVVCMLALTMHPLAAHQNDTCAERQTVAQAPFGPDQQPVLIIFDTDFAEDVDDVGALALLHAFADHNEAEILAVMISSGNGHAARAVDAVNTYFDRSDLPIGVSWDYAANPSSRYTFELAYDFPNDISTFPNAVDLYREVLAAQPDQSVTIVSVGFLTNLSQLLTSQPDAHSSLDGTELVTQKVARLVVMGGAYPDSEQHIGGAEYNFALDAAATVAVVEGWPTPIVFSGFEIGVNIETGGVLQDGAPVDSPVREAYQLYNAGRARSSWDLTTVHYAVRGTDDLWVLCVGGTNSVDADGRNRWLNTNETRQAYLLPALPAAQIAERLDELLIQVHDR